MRILNADIPMRKINGKLAYDFKSYLNKDINIEFNHRVYVIQIEKIEKQNLFIKYDNKDLFKINRNNFLKGHVRTLFRHQNDFVYKIGEVINTKSSIIEIIDTIIDKSKMYYKLQCKTCDYEYNIPKGTFEKRLIGCSVCNNRTIIKGINDIATTHSYLVKYFVNINDTYTHSFGSGDKALMKCPDCGAEKRMIISDLSTYGFSCNKCSDGFSYPNKIMYNILDKMNIDFIPEYNNKDLNIQIHNKNRKIYYDFYIPSLNLIIEMDGGFHKQHNTLSGQTLDKSIEIDRLKDELAIKNNLKIVRIDCDVDFYSDYKLLINNILNSELKHYLDFNYIDMDDVKVIVNNFVKEVCVEYMKHKNFKILESKFHFSYPTIIKYLKLGREFNWCDYKTQYEKGLENYNKAIQLWNDGINSTQKIADIMHMNYTSIIKILKKGYKEGLCDYQPIIGYQNK